MEIQSGTKQRINLVAHQFPSLHHIQFLHQLFIKGTGKKRPDGNLRGLRADVHADAGRAVGSSGHRNAVILLQGFGQAAEAGSHAGRHSGRAHSFAPHHDRKLLCGKLFKRVPVHGRLV